MKFGKLLKLFFFFLILVININFFPAKASSPQEFQHLINAQYDIKENGDAYVEYRFKTTNKLRNNYLRSFNLTLPFEPLNVQVKDSETPVKIKNLSKVTSTNIYKLEIEILSPIYGYDKSFEWRFSFDLKSMVLDHGMQKSITIPTFENDPNILGYQINASIPKSFGEISSVYGNSTFQEIGDRYFMEFKSGSALASSVIILIGKEQEYFLESTEQKETREIPLPFSNSSQKVTYANFPERIIYESDEDLSNYITLREQEKISAVIKTVKAENRALERGTLEPSSNHEFINKLAGGIVVDNNSKANTAEILYKSLPKYFSISNSRINIDTNIQLSEGKTELNPLELNKIYRELLAAYDIESRGVYGFVFPIQPFQREDFVTEQHVWTEANIDGKWITIDPTWLLTSKGVNYFDANSFHHIKFGNYQTIEELKRFLTASEFISLTPLTSSQQISSTQEIKVKVDKESYSNKEIRLTINNTSNQIIELKDISLSLENLNGINLVDNRININKSLYPNSSIYLTVSVQYGILPIGKQGNLKIDLHYFDGEGEEKEIGFVSNLKIQSNVSNYIAIGFLIFVTGFGLLSVFVLSFYRRRVNFS